MAGATPAADVAVCHHVIYNVPEPVPFVEALTAHARRRVVLELMPAHPVSNLNDLWMRFHGLRRPTRPTADDFVAVLAEMGIAPGREEWEAARLAGGLHPARGPDRVHPQAALPDRGPGPGDLGRDLRPRRRAERDDRLASQAERDPLVGRYGGGADTEISRQSGGRRPIVG